MRCRLLRHGLLTPGYAPTGGIGVTAAFRDHADDDDDFVAKDSARALQSLF
eukprot:COSAG05_NODE_22378_length_265_cov_0.626506_1_plen_50_part_10